MPDSIRLFPPEPNQGRSHGKQKEPLPDDTPNSLTLVVGHPQGLDDLSELWKRTSRNGQSWTAISAPPFPASGLWRVKDWLATPAGEAISAHHWHPATREVIFLQEDLRYLDIVATLLSPARQRIHYTLRGEIAFRLLGVRVNQWCRLNRECLPTVTACLKRGLDLLGGIALLPLAACLILALIPPLAIVNRGRVFERKWTAGLHGKPFWRWSFASSKHGYGEIVELSSQATTCCTKGREMVARLITNACIEALPGILRVVTGQMSFLGPRPVQVSEVLEMPGEDLVCLKRKPGLFSLMRRSASAK